ncbi:reverse transcriptase/maturase family protein [Priestia megaterium]|uniref:reverse transcriptase/maturase family protein n=1 Tax=Priestia megaterium TaxID=1404 RepID=UPI0024484B36|nr:reverse transcriptase/maturase family protein [Priestia megaterium]MDH2364117.1 reverse transcriptase domain-containing protein [Priestia megaterium]
MRNPRVVLDNLVNKSCEENYEFNRLYRNMYNEEFYLLAYSNIYAKEGNMTKGTDGKTIDGFSLERVHRLIEQLRNESYQPNPSRRREIPKGNGGKRPLGIPSFDDKLIQEIMRMILEAIYEGKFQESSHGFRPNRSCHTALEKVQLTFTASRWFVEGDIKSFFDNIDHHKLIEILERHIKDQKFIRLIWKFLRAGYLEDWVYHKTYSGAPQGGVISPILSNIFLNELDKFVGNLQAEFSNGKVRKRNPKYRNLEYQVGVQKKWLKTHWDKLDKEGKGKGIKKYKELRKKMLKVEHRDPMDPDYKRIQYVRYADDFIIGVIGSKSDCIRLKEKITNFLWEELKLSLSQEKTLITNSKNFARFLGYDIKVRRNQGTKKLKTGNTQRVFNYQCVLYLPQEKWVKKLKELRAIVMQRDGKWKPIHRTELINNEPLEIQGIYNAEIRGLYNYYKLAINVSSLHSFNFFMKFSYLKTLGRKYKSSVKKMYDKFSVNGKLAVKYETVKGSKLSFYYNDGFRRKKASTDDTDRLPLTAKYSGRSSVTQRLLANKCEHCGNQTAKMEVHHVKKLKNLKGKKQWEQFMIARRRKTLVLCHKCHVDLHKGKLD